MVSVGDLKDLCFSLDTWKTIMGIFLRRWDDNKPKPMRMLLRSLAHLISKDPFQERSHAKKDHAVHRSLAIINNQNESVSVKPAFQVLDHLLSKDLVNAKDIICAYAVLDGVRTPLSPIDSVHQPPSSEAMGLSKSEWKLHGRDFILAIFNWIRYSDIAADAGRLVGKVIQSFNVLSNATSENNRPLWASPLRQFIHKHPESLEAITNHVLPVLLKIDHNDTFIFLQSLPWESLRRGDNGDLSDADIVLCLLTADFTTEVRLSNGSGKQ